MISAIANFARRRERDCRIARRALEKWLGFLTPLRWLMVSFTTILSALAAATILGKKPLIGQSYELFAGLCALGSAILSGLHTALRCDPHQAECRHMISQYRGLEAGFQSISDLDEPTASTKLQDLESKYEQLLSSAREAAPESFVRAAEKEFGSANPQG